MDCSKQKDVLRFIADVSEYTGRWVESLIRNTNNMKNSFSMKYKLFLFYKKLVYKKVQEQVMFMYKYYELLLIYA